MPLFGGGGPVPWPPRSPDLSSLDYFLWGHLKNLVSTTPVDSDEDLVARISVTAAPVACVREIPGIFECVRQSLHRRCRACITVGGRNFRTVIVNIAPLDDAVNKHFVFPFHLLFPVFVPHSVTCAHTILTPTQFVS
ncbi:hypothetical protein AVEN_138553-1 [Araneus ventricosus]|uniref:Uncharacterized protein n=1 Tax=Araneus ventricosus TaxID=182803 RepID=A0A4Y2PXP8_ARAVE|nr:hypothetical protein AVEN_138553-1 [Araneus ventricosus]